MGASIDRRGSGRGVQSCPGVTEAKSAMSDQGTMKRYLLGKASPEERADLENRYLSDASLFEELTEAENDLIDSYVRGKLSDFDRQEFERQYLGPPQRRARVQFASALTEISREPRQVASVQKSSFWQSLTFLFSQSSPKLRWGLAAGAVAMVLVIGWLKTTSDRSLRASLPPPHVEPNGRPQSPGTAAPAPNGQVPGGGNTAGIEIAKADKPELDEFTVQLTPGISRSGGAEARVFALPPKAPWIKLRLALDNDDHPAYVAVVETAEGNVIQRIGGLKSQLSGGNKVVDLQISSRLIQADDYVVKLSGTLVGTKGGEEEVDVYSFRAVNK